MTAAAHATFSIEQPFIREDTVLLKGTEWVGIIAQLHGEPPEELLDDDEYEDSDFSDEESGDDSDDSEEEEENEDSDMEDGESGEEAGGSGEDDELEGHAMCPVHGHVDVPEDHVLLEWVAGPHLGEAARSPPSIQPYSALELLDRPLLPGDIAAIKISDGPDGTSRFRMGTVVDVDLKCMVKRVFPNAGRDDHPHIPETQVLHAAQLEFIHASYSQDNTTVVTQSSAGILEEHQYSLVIEFPSENALATISDEQIVSLTPSSVRFQCTNGCPFYPGQEVEEISEYENITWIRGHLDESCLTRRCIIRGVRVVGAEVRTYFSTTAEEPSDMSFEISGLAADLKSVDPLQFCDWQVGHIAMALPSNVHRPFGIVFAPTWTVLPPLLLHASAQLPLALAVQIEDSDDVSATRSSEWKDISGGYVARELPLEPYVVMITATETTVRIQWRDDRTVSEPLRTTQLLSVHTDFIGEKDFFPEDIIMESTAPTGIDDLTKYSLDAGKRQGLIRSVDNDRRTAKVAWLLHNADLETDPETGLPVEEEVSLFEIEDAKSMQFRIGDTVGRFIGPVAQTTRSYQSANEIFPYPCRDDAINMILRMREVYLRDKDAFVRCDDVEATPLSLFSWPDYPLLESIQGAAVPRTFIPWAGQVVGLRDGLVFVSWIDGTCSACRRSDLILIRSEDNEWDVESSDAGSDGSDGSWETLSDVDGTDVADLHSGDVHGDAGAETGDSLQSRLREEIDGFRISSDLAAAASDANAGLNVAPSTAAAAASSTATVVTRESCPTIERFRMLDAGAEENHWFHRNPAPEGRKLLRQIPGKLMARLSGEMQSLNGLPPGIFVRGYENRLDLFTAVIVGPTGTPYENALFCVDMALPADYPMSPPIAHYYSYDERVNPNLYENGRICLSLLGTWQGREDCEVWSPTSTIFQVLVSLQSLVLNAAPYYNEAGFEVQVGDRKASENADQYNESVYIRVLRANILRTLQRPPPSVSDIIDAHYTHAAKTIVAIATKLCETSAASPPTPAVPQTSESPATAAGIRVPPSHGFAITLRKLLPQLRAALKVEEEKEDNAT